MKLREYHHQHKKQIPIHEIFFPWYYNPSKALKDRILNESYKV